MTQSIVIFILIAVFQAVASYYAKKAKEKQAAADAAGRGEGSGVGTAPSLDGTRPVQVNSVRPMSAQQATAVARLIERGNVVGAVMALRAICNIGLAEARDVINQFPARGFPAELLPTQSAVPTIPVAGSPAAARALAPAPPVVEDDFDPEARSQDGDENESNDAGNSLASVRAAVDEVRTEVQTVRKQALRAAGVDRPSAPEPLPHAVVMREATTPASAPTSHKDSAVVSPYAERVSRAQAILPRGQRSVVAESVAVALRTRQGVRQALLMAEILGPPRAMRPFR